jgi:hypothetical protein
MKVSEILVKFGLGVFAISVFVNTVIYKMPKLLSIIIYGVAGALILIGGVFFRYESN